MRDWQEERYNLLIFFRGLMGMEKTNGEQNGLLPLTEQLCLRIETMTDEAEFRRFLAHAMACSKEGLEKMVRFEPA